MVISDLHFPHNNVVKNGHRHSEYFGGIQERTALFYLVGPPLSFLQTSVYSLSLLHVLLI